MEGMFSSEVIQQVTDFIDISKKDPKAEVECKLLSGRIETKDVADRILKAIQTLGIGPAVDETRLSMSYPDNTRVNVLTPPLVHKVCVQGSFKDVPVLVETKKEYYERGLGKKSVVDVSDANARFTLRSEKDLRRDWEGSPNDPKGYLRIIQRKSFKTANELFRIDFSMVKSRPTNSKQQVKDVVKQQPKYELEIEFIHKKSTVDSSLITKEYLKILERILQAYYQTQFLLSTSDIQRYVQEFKMTNNIFFNPVTLERRYLTPESPYNISEGYTVTNKADGDRSGLYVARDRKVLRIPSNVEQLVWTGITARDDSHVGDFIDGEYIAQNNLFCIFDIYRFRNRDIKSLPLLTNDEDLAKNPLKSRLGCAKLFIEDLKTQFLMSPSSDPLRVETKLFLAGDGMAMEEAIKTMLTTQFEYETDGLIFTPRNTGVAPHDQRRGKTWTRVYKWKPPHQNSIDFLLRYGPEDVNDPVTGQKAKKGELYVSKSPGDDVVYPRETMNGEYVPKKLPEDLQKVADVGTRIPALFQPSTPKDPDAYNIYVPVDSKGIPVDEDGNRVEDNTIVECSFDTEKYKWVVMRTRYDKTYKYRVLKEPQFGNDISVADNIWTSIHVPITERMISAFLSNPADLTFEDDMYYRDDLKRESRGFADVYSFHNRIKDDLYKNYIKKDDTLLELACGRGGDMLKIKSVKPSKVVGIDISLSNIESPMQGAAKRYIKQKREYPREYLPPTLYLVGDMTQYPLFEQEDRYMPILTGKITPPNQYLSQFEGLTKFDDISCQFALHYACESEEVFRSFAKNIDKYGKGYFFGTCSDGKSIYSLLMDKKSHIFTNNKQVVGEYTKQYLDKDTWTEEFGMPVKVMLESFDKPAVEYLVPFEKVTEIMQEYGWELIDSKLFNDIYSQQTNVMLTQEQQIFSFLNRTFVFHRMKGVERKEAKEEIKEQEAKQEDDEKNEAPIEEIVKSEEEPKPEEEKKEEEPKPEEEKKEEEVKTEEEKPKKRKLKKLESDVEPILFHGADESQGEYRWLSNDSYHPIDMNGEQFKTVEHYFQAMKAKEFGDTETYNKIIKSKTPKAAKALGKKVTNLVTEVWESKRDPIMQDAVRAKFVQHPELRKKLMETEDKPIGKADARDMYWGIGTSVDSEKSKYPSKWRGFNKLGKILMSLRKTFKEESSLV